MNSNRAYIDSLKDGVEEVFRIIRRDTDTGGTARDDNRIIKAQKSGIASAHSMILTVYNFAESEHLDENHWVVTSIKTLLKLTRKPAKRLIEIIRLPFNIELDGDVDADTFYKNKQSAINDYTEIEKIRSNFEEILQTVDDDGGITRRSRGDFLASWPELNADKSSMAGYNKKIDAIVIDPLGTVGEIRSVYGLRIALPKKPPKTDYWNTGVPRKRNQYWQRKKMPKTLAPETQGAYHEYIQQQYDYKHEGVWFMNDGEPTYLTGAHWFLLQWGKTGADGDKLHDKGFFHYREAQRDLYYWMEAVWADERALGIIYIKTRRTGATFSFIDFMLCKALSYTDCNYGMTSKTDGDGKAIFNIMFIQMFANLPFFYKPIRLSDTPKQTLEFREPQRRITKTNKNEAKEYEALNTEISYRATTDDAYDQYAMKLYLGDEFSKWKKPQDILNHWRMFSRALTKGGNITGKAFLFSTLENVKGFDDPEDKDAGMGDKFIYLYNRSDVAVRNANGRTQSGLYGLFIPSTDNFEGFIDLFGRAVKDTPKEKVRGVDGRWITQGINEFLTEESNSFKTAKELYDYWRLNPRNLHEAMRVAADHTIFDIRNIMQQVDYNQENDVYVSGNFEWMGGIKPLEATQAMVEFVPSIDGRFKVAWVPDSKYWNAKIIKANKPFPGNGFAGAFGCDPYRASETVSRRGSNGAIHGCTGEHNSIGPSNKIFLEYVTRPDSIDTFTWDIIKASVFYGMPVLIESNVTDSLRLMREWGYRGYSMNRPDKKPSILNLNERELGGYPATQDTIDGLTNVTAWFVREFVGRDMEKMPFNITMNDWIKYKKEARTKHDATVSSSLAIFASRSRHQQKKVEVSVKAPRNLIKRFKVNGYNSQKVS